MSEKFLSKGHEVIGVDNINNYYDINLKSHRLSLLQEKYPNQFIFFKKDITDKDALKLIFLSKKIDSVFHFAAQAGVRYSLECPNEYINSNIIGFFNLLEACREESVKNVYFASSSSVYGNQSEVPFNENENTDYPESIYAVTKKTNELFAFTYSKLYGINMTGFRFFTVYGPLGRPDMAPMKFLKALHSNSPINIYNNGNLSRDFTYIDDITTSIEKVYNKDEDYDYPNYRIFNIGNSNPVQLLDFIETLEKATKKTFLKNYTEMQKGDVFKTFANVTLLESYIGKIEHINLKEGVTRLVKWYQTYYKSNKT